MKYKGKHEVSSVVTAKEEAEMIVSILFDKYGSIGVVPPTLPLFVDGKKAIKWLKDKNLPYGEVEWPGYYIKHYTRCIKRNYCYI